MIRIRIAEEQDFNKEVILFLKSFAIVDVQSCNTEDIPKIISEYDVFWFRLGFQIGKNELGGSIKCKVLATPVTGIDHIDEEECSKRGIEVLCLREEREFLKEVRATAELTIALTLDLLRKTKLAQNSAVYGVWQRDLFRGHEIFNKKIGIIGYGRLGSITASFFEAFGAKVYFTDSREVCAQANHVRLKDISEIIRVCDIISLHVNLNKNNTNLLDSKTIGLFNESKYLINTSRGALVDEDALLKQLKSGKLGGAALDVVKKEFSWTKDNPLAKYARKHSNLIITPHIGGNTFESFEKTEWFIAHKIKEYFTNA